MSDNSDSDSSYSVEDISLKPIQPRPLARNINPSNAIETAEDRIRQTVFSTPNRQLTKQIAELTLTKNISKKETETHVRKFSENDGQDGEIFPPVIPLNVGGVKYMTRLSTLRKYEDSMLAAMFSGRHVVDKDEYGNYFLDSNGHVFTHIIDFLRNGTVPPNEVSVSVYKEANYFGLHELVELLQFKPNIAALHVKEAHRLLFPNYFSVKQNIVKVAMENAITTKSGDVVVHMFKSEFFPKAPNFNPKHGCVAENAHVTIGPWEGDTDEEMFIRCLESDYLDEGFNIKPHETKRKCRYYHGQTCPKFTYKITFIF